MIMAMMARLRMMVMMMAMMMTYPDTKTRKQAARELHASCARARTHEGDDENASEGEGECEGEDEAEGDDDGDCDGGGQPAACGQEPLAASCFSLVAGRQSMPTASRQSENDNVMCSVKQHIFVISSVFLSVASVLAGREMICPIEKHASHPIEKYASHPCEDDLPN